MKQFNIYPYYDDFDSDKHFHKILYRPGYTVQTRELNQSQSILQDQINKFADHIFNNGSVVIPGGIQIKTDQSYAKLVLTGNTTFEGLSSYDGLYVQSSTTFLKANVVMITNIENADPVTVFIDYVDSGTTTTENAFALSDGISFYSIVGGIQTLVGTATVTDEGEGTIAIIAEGVYYINGTFVSVDTYYMPVSKYSTTPTKRVGFDVQETIVTADDDNSLYSNAYGEPNFKSEGAHRYKITLSPKVIDVSDTEDEGFVELAQVKDGVLQSLVTTSNYSTFGKELARRTHEESGDYTVNSFDITIQDHLDDGTNDGYDELGDESKFVANIRGGLGYIQGYRVENAGIQDIVMDKSRDTRISQNLVASTLYGNYITVTGASADTSPFGIPEINVALSYDLYDTAVDDSIPADVSWTKIGTTRIRSIKHLYATKEMLLYIFDTSFDTGKSISDVKGIRYYNATTNKFFGAKVLNGAIQMSGLNKMLFSLPTTANKTLKPNGISDTSYTVMKSFSVQLSAGIVNIPVSGSNQVFDSIDTTDYVAAVDFNPLNSFSGAKGKHFVLDITNTSGATTPTLTINLSSHIGVSITGDEFLTVIAPVIKQTPVEKSKIKSVNTETITLTNESKSALHKPDIFNIISVIDDNAQDITEMFTFESGMRSSFYDDGSIKTLSGESITSTFDVTYNYYSHGPGDYFTVDSYIGATADEIPVYTAPDGTAYDLRNTIDFRPTKSGGVFVSGSNGDIIRSNDTIRFDAEYYLSRVDSLYVSSLGEYGVTKGISDLSPTQPNVPDNAMKIYNLLIPAFTFSIDDISVVQIENKRYTMRDIGALEDRIANVEYYTSLSLLENTALTTQVLDPVTGNSRFKNGFVVDSFTDTTLSDIDDTSYNASIDTENGVLMPNTTVNASDIIIKSIGSASLTGSRITLPYIEEVSVKQPYATSHINVNPFAVFTWIGTLKLTPSKDYWVDNKYRTPIYQTVNTKSRTTSTVRKSRWKRWRWWDLSSVIKSTSVSSYKTSATSLVDQYTIPWMRSIDINFTASNLRPYTKVYAKFDGKDVTSYCTPSTLSTNINGKVSGVFKVPNSDVMRFKTGTSIFEITDSLDDDTGSTFTDAQFLSGGTARVYQKTITTHKNVNTNIATIRWRDPVAQTFICAKSGGEFITSVEVFFKTKALNIPVTLQIRETSVGTPTTNILNFAEKTLTPSEVVVSDNGDVPTKFTFDDLVQLEEGKEYAIVVIADTQEYNIFYAEMGQVVLGSRQSVSKQPHLGVMFTSQNGSTWSEYQNRDLKFTLNKAKFDTSVKPVIQFECSDPVVLPLDFNAISTTVGSPIISISIPSHGLKAGLDTIVITGASAGNGLDSGTLNDTHAVISGTTDMVVKVDVGVNATSSGPIGSGDMLVSVNYPMTVIHPTIDVPTLDGTVVKWEYSVKSQSTRSMTSFTEFIMNDDIMTDEEGVVIDGSSDLILRATIESDSSDLTPIIDVDGANVVFIQPQFDAVGSADPVYKYITKNIEFTNSSTTANLYIGAKLPGNSSMIVQYKAAGSSDDDLDVVEWVSLSPTVPIRNDDSFVEYVYMIDGIGPFVSAKYRIMLTGDDKTKIPQLTDFRVIALA